MSKTFNFLDKDRPDCFAGVEVVARHKAFFVIPHQIGDGFETDREEPSCNVRMGMGENNRSKTYLERFSEPSSIIPGEWKKIGHSMGYAHLSRAPAKPENAPFWHSSVDLVAVPYVLQRPYKVFHPVSSNQTSTESSQLGSGR